MSLHKNIFFLIEFFLVEMVTFVIISVPLSLYSQILPTNKNLSAQKNLNSRGNERTDSIYIRQLLEQCRKNYRNLLDSARKDAQIALVLSLSNNMPAEQAEARYFIGYIFYAKGEFDSARSYLGQSYQYYEQHQQNREMSQVLIELSKVYVRQGLFTEGQQALFQGLRLAEKLRDSSQQASIFIQLSLLYQEQQEYDDALKALSVARTFITDTLGREMMNVLALEGRAYTRMGEYQKGLAFSRRAIVLSKYWNDTRTTAHTLFNIGEDFRGLNLPDSALKYFFQCRTLRQEQKNQQGIAEVSAAIATVYLRVGKFQSAIDYGIQAYTLSQAINAKPVKQTAAETLASAFHALGNDGVAFDYLQTAKVLKDSLRNEDNARTIAKRESLYQQEKKQKEIIILQEQQRRQQTIQYSLLAGLGLVAILVFVLMNNNSKKKNANKKLTEQKHLLERQATEIQLTNTELQEKNVEITAAHTETQRLLTNVNDSIRYAKRIQDAMLPSTETLNRLLPEHFIFFRPKDVVSGDFYWCKEVGGKVFVAAVDCTGHGVPGAFMSLIGNALLNEITTRLLDPHPDLVLNELHHELQTALRQRETNNDDGMDICLCMIDLDTRIVEFAGAMNPLYAVVAGELREFKGTPEELGGREERSPKYARHVLDLSETPEGAAMLYLTTDGYKDQYNDVQQRFMPKRLRPLLLGIAGKPLEEQLQLLGEAIDAHRGKMFQVDDMLVLGVKL